jgi:FixJ family two-component response regulator
MRPNALIYIVEDNRVVAEALAYRLSQNPSNTVKLFSTGEEMLTEMNKKPDVIILDYYLKSENKLAKDGNEIIESIGSIPVIVLSNNNDIPTAMNMIHLGACDYINKQDAQMFLKVEKSVEAVMTTQYDVLEVKNLNLKSKSDMIRVVVIVNLLILITSVLLLSNL